MYEVYFAQRFNEKLQEQEKEAQRWANKIANQVALEPYVGKPLSKKWFREKKLGAKRIYFLIYEDYKCIYFVNISDKKDQQETIGSIKLRLETFRKEMEKIMQNKLSEP